MWKSRPLRQWLPAGRHGANGSSTGPGTPGQSFGGNYGEPTPPDLGFAFSAPADDDDADDHNCTCAVQPDHSGVVIPNALSPLSLAELLRRLVLHRAVAPERRFPGVSWADVQDMLYGARTPALYPAAQARWGGMSADTAIFVQAALGDLPARAARSGGQWRIFSKLGAGFSDSRGGVGEVLTVAYACVPVLGAQNAGLEFVLAARASVKGDVLLEDAQLRVKAAVDAAVAWVQQGANG